MSFGAEITRAALPDRGVDFAVYDWGGSGPPALLAHANGVCAALWDPSARRLKDQYRVLAFDHRGQGDSSLPQGPDKLVYAWTEFTDDYLALSRWVTQEFRLSQPIYAVGHSFGGTAVLNSVARHPKLYDRACVFDPVLPPPQTPAGAKSNRGLELAAKTRERRSVWPSRSTVAAAWRDKELFAPWCAESLALYIEHGFRDRSDGKIELKCDPQVEAAVFSDPGGAGLKVATQSITRPALIAHATKGHVPRERIQDVVREAPFVEAVHVSMDHLMVMEDPEAIAKIILDFGGQREAG